MKVRDLIQQEIDIDVYDDVCEELGIAFCGPAKLTEAGEKKFADVLELPVEIKRDYAVVGIDDPDDKVWKARLKKAKLLFNSLAGYCSVSDFEKWFAN
ncbi:MAG: hypothetical protein J6Y20_07425 [Lachnospiraceae bacterium]|nr:hypothetical protein [Lachnospiraceae bacterium]